MDDLVDEHNALAAEGAEHDGAEGGADIGCELLLPALAHLRLDRHGLERLDAGHRLDQEGLVGGAALEALLDAAAERRGDAQGERGVERDRAEHDVGERRRVGVHHCQEDDGEGQVEHQGQGRAGEKIADVLELAHPCHGLAHLAGLEIGDRQGKQMAEQPRAELDIDPAGGVREDVGAQPAEHDFEQGDRDKPDDQDIKGCKASMNQHLVDHNLEEQRRDQAEELQEERRQHDLAEQAPILDDGRDEPGPVEEPLLGVQLGTARHQDGVAGPELGKFI